MTMRCSRCRRILSNPVYVGGSPMGATCAAAVIGPRPRRRAEKTRAPDERQAQLFHVEKVG